MRIELTVDLLVPLEHGAVKGSQWDVLRTYEGKTEHRCPRVQFVSRRGNVITAIVGEYRVLEDLPKPPALPFRPPYDASNE